MADYEWPNPARARPAAKGWTQSRPFYYVDTAIQRQSDWPNPLVKRANRVGWTHDRPQYYIDAAPHNNLMPGITVYLWKRIA